MQRQFVEAVALASIVVYATIAVSGDVLHAMTGLDCRCHVSRDFASRQYDTEAMQLKCRSCEVALGVAHRCGESSGSPSNDAVRGQDHCPICHWFSMAQQEAAALRLDAYSEGQDGWCWPGVAARQTWVRSVGARGPPLQFSVL